MPTLASFFDLATAAWGPWLAALLGVPVALAAWAGRVAAATPDALWALANAIGPLEWGLALFGGVLYRIRGGWLGRYIPGGTTPARLIWILPTGTLVCAYSTAHPLAVFWFATLMEYAGLLIPHGRQQDIGRAEGKALEDGLHMAAIGDTRMMLVLAVPALEHPVVFWGAFFGWLQGVCYAVAWRYLPWKKEKWVGDQYFIDFPTAWAEFLWGIVQWWTIIAVLKHHAALAAWTQSL